MKKTALRKEFWMSIKRSPGRFFSIFLIVALGVSFFSGIRSSEPDMRISGDRYYDEKHLMDLKVQGTLGLTEEDVRVLSEVDGIASAEGGYSVDALCKAGENEKVIHIVSSYQTVNEATVSEGRMPKSASECLLDEDFMRANGYKIGEKISLSSGTEEKLSKSLKHEQLTIVGAGSSPEYISIERGSSLIGNGEVSGFAVVAPEAFAMDVYSEIYLLVDGAKVETCYTDGYDDLIKEVKERVEDVAEVACLRRTEEVQTEALKEIEKAQKEFDESEQKAYREFEEAEQKLYDGEQEIAEGQKQIDDGKTALLSGKKEIEKQEASLKSAETQYENGMVLLKTGKAELQRKKEELSEGQRTAQSEFAAQEKALADQKQELEEAAAQIVAAEQELEKQETQLAEARAAWQEKQDEFEKSLAAFTEQEELVSVMVAQAQKEIESAEQTISQGQIELDELQKQIERLEAEMAADPGAVTEEMKAQLEEWKQQWEIRNKELADIQVELEKKRNWIQLTLEELEKQREALEQGRSELEKADRILTEQENLFHEQAEPARKELAEKKAQVEKGLMAIEAGEVSLEQAKKQVEEQFAFGKQQIAAGESEIQSSESELLQAASKIADGKNQIVKAAALMAEQENKLEQAEEELKNGKADLEEGWKEYEIQRADAQKALADAQEEIEEARAEVATIEAQEWYVNDRDVLAEYTSYGENADRMRAIGEVFPELFFLVAALISLTSMTRMVEEERTQIGTMKALGYGKGAIAGKYLMYAFLATLGGSIVGVLIGEKIFPYIIIHSYQIMYTHLPHIVIPYQWDYAVLATAVALACTLLATLYACYKELAAQPAELMRPPSPKEGKRILLERVTLIWKHLSFIWKSSIRNLFRYKKRFFMTIAGIGGCMALMIVGFGLRDSIMCIGTIQYQELQVYDGMVYLSNTTTEDQMKQITETLDGMKKMDLSMKMEMTREPVSSSVNGKKEEVYVCVPQDKEVVNDFMIFRDRISGERYFLKDDGVILTEKMANTLDVSVGSKIYIGNDGNEKEVTVSEICENYMEHYVYMTADLYQEVYGEAPAYNSLLFKLKNASDQEISKAGEEILKYDGVMNVTYTNSIEDQLNKMLQTLDLVIVVLIISAGMLAFVVLYNLNNINITERRREMATLKVLGFYDMEISSYVYRENMMLTALSIVVGIFLGALLHRFVITTVEVDAVMFGRVVNWQSYLYSALFTIAFSFFVNWVMYYKLKNIDMVESLKSVE